MLVDIAAIPGENVLQEARRLSSAISMLATDDIELATASVLPHVSLLIMDVDEPSVEELKAAIPANLGVRPDGLRYGSLTQDAKSLRVFWNGVGHGWRDLHKAVLELGSRYHSFASEDLWMTKGKRYSHRQLAYVRMYGSPYVCEFFQPHITIARLDRTVDLTQIELSQEAKGIDRVGLFLLDERYRAVQEI